METYAVAAPEPPAFRTLTGLYEPSAIQQLPDGRFIVVEDEKERPLSLVRLNADAQVSSETVVVPDSLGPDDPFAGLRKLDDLEGVTLDRAGYVYAITSHSRNDDGETKKSREKLIRFRIEGDRIQAGQVHGGLKQALVDAHPLLAEAAAVRDVKNAGGLNIEALELSADQARLMIGFRSPLQAGRAVIAYLDNPQGLFERAEAPRIAAELTTLDLGGHGLRGMAYVPALGGYLLLSGPVAKEPVQFGLWFWSGRLQDPARLVSVEGLPGFEHAEGVTAAVIDGLDYILIVSDDGSRSEGRFARFLLRAPEQLRIRD